jgi:hypothetical protein
MNLTLRITGIQEQEDWSREAEIDTKLHEMNIPPTKANVQSLLDEIPERYKVVLDLIIKNREGRRIGSLTMPIEDWPGVAEVGNEWGLAG